MEFKCLIKNTQLIELYLVIMKGTLKNFTTYECAFNIFRYVFWVYLKPTIVIKSVGKVATF